MTDETKNSIGVITLVSMVVFLLVSKNLPDTKQISSTMATECSLNEFDKYQESCFLCTNQPYTSVSTCHEIARSSLEKKIALCHGVNIRANKTNP